MIMYLIRVESYPDGLDVAVFSFALLEEAYNKCSELYDLEHVTPYMKKNDSIKRFNIKNEIDFSDIRITVDEARSPCNEKYICSIW